MTCFPLLISQQKSTDHKVGGRRHISEQRTLIKTTVRFRRKIQLSVLAGLREQRATSAVSLRSSSQVPIWILFSMQPRQLQTESDQWGMDVDNQNSSSRDLAKGLTNVTVFVSFVIHGYDRLPLSRPCIRIAAIQHSKTGAATISCLFFFHRCSSSGDLDVTTPATSLLPPETQLPPQSAQLARWAAP